MNARHLVVLLALGTASFTSACTYIPTQGAMLRASSFKPEATPVWMAGYVVRTVVAHDDITQIGEATVPQMVSSLEQLGFKPFFDEAANAADPNAVPVGGTTHRTAEQIQQESRTGLKDSHSVMQGSTWRPNDAPAIGLSDLESTKIAFATINARLRPEQVIGRLRKDETTPAYFAFSEISVVDRSAMVVAATIVIYDQNSKKVFALSGLEGDPNGGIFPDHSPAAVQRALQAALKRAAAAPVGNL